jgi:hypothetical protein
VLRHRPHDLELDRSFFGLRRRWPKVLPSDLLPAHSKMGGDVGDSGAAKAGGNVVPADLGPGVMSTRVEAVAVL